MQVESFERRVLMPIRFGEFMVERQLLSDGQLLDVLADHWHSGARIGDVVVKRGFVKRDMVEEVALEYHGGLPVLEIEA